MSDINEIKSRLQLGNYSYKKRGDEFSAPANETISSLITTIESQKEEMLESIRRDQSERHELFLQIESLKAITELAVNAFKLITKGNIDFPTWTDTVDVLRDVRIVARETISEIERLQNEKP